MTRNGRTVPGAHGSLPPSPGGCAQTTVVDSSKQDSPCTEFAAHAGAALRALLSMVRHELGSIAMVCADADADASGCPSLHSVASGERLATDLLCFARRQDLAPAAFAPGPFLTELANLLRRGLDRNIEVQVHVDDACPLVHADPQALKHALISVAINARDAMPEGGHLRLHAAPTELDGSKCGVALAVSDTGTGMTAEVAARAASPFFSTKPNSPMSGLGLAAVDGFARQSGGSMSLHTGYGTGTTVTLLLPARW